MADLLGELRVGVAQVTGGCLELAAGVARIVKGLAKDKLPALCLIRECKAGLAETLHIRVSVRRHTLRGVGGMQPKKRILAALSALHGPTPVRGE